MALENSIETKYGYAATYWRIVNINHDFTRQNIYAELAGYKDGETRNNADSIPLVKFGFHLHKIGLEWQCDLGNVTYSVENFTMPENVTREWIYTFIKGLEYWKSAKDV